MLNNRHLTMAVCASALGTLLMGGLFIYPNYRKASTIHNQVKDLRSKMSDVDGRRNQIAQLTTDLQTLQARVETELKQVPASPDVAGLIRKLSQEVDHSTVMDQTFTAGAMTDALPDGAEGVQALPVTVDMSGRFDSVFALVRSAESVKRLVRVASVHLLCKRDEKTPDSSIVEATISLEAIFDPPAAPKEH